MAEESSLANAPLETRVLVLRGKRVILDADLALLYEVTTSRLKEQVRRNQSRFPGDFAFTLTSTEKAEVIANCDHLRNLRYSNRLPLALTEHGVIMTATVLNSERAVAMSVLVVRAFIRMREVIAAHTDLAEKLAKLERRVGTHDAEIEEILAALRALVEPPSGDDRRRIGFRGE